MFIIRSTCQKVQKVKHLKRVVTDFGKTKNKEMHQTFTHQTVNHEISYV